MKDKNSPAKTKESGIGYPQELRDRCKRLYAVTGSLVELQEHIPVQIARQTLAKWRDEDEWEEARREYLDKGIELQEFIFGLKTMKEEDVDRKIQRLSKETLAVILVSFMNDLKKNPENAVLMSSPIQKLTSALEKIVNTEIKSKNGGVERKEVRVVKYDFDKILEIQLKYRKEGLTLTPKEAMEIIDQQRVRDVTPESPEDN